ncbi:MAG: hypothetical protein KatS3mg088_016 [Patescibacteria group bacterium]|nr:MAG: hypothetical protein KatS3mg088_016 [Patescibacteria group bacterium]
MQLYRSARDYFIKNFPIVKDHTRFVVHPINSATQRKSLSNKNKKIRSFINKLYKKELTKLDGVKKLLLSFGCNLEEEKRYLNKGFRKLQIFTYPIPDNLRNVINRSRRVVVLEQGDGFAKQKIVALSSNERIEACFGKIPDKSSGYIISNNYKKLFSAIKRTKPSFVVGDLGEYTQDTLDTIDACLCFGSALGVGVGGILAGAKNVISVTGDGAYLHSGKNVIPEAIKRGVPLKAVIICNGGCKGTGGAGGARRFILSTKGC